MFSKFIALLFVVGIMGFLVVHPLFAASQPFSPTKQEYEKATVIATPQNDEIITDGQTQLFQKLMLKITDGSDAGKTINLNYGDQQTLTKNQEVSQGQTVILLKTTDQSGKTIYTVYDIYRLPQIILIVLLFAVIVVAIAQVKGIGSLVGLAISLSIILFFIVPQILHGQNPLAISIIGGLIILFITTYIAHGISRQTTIALAGTVIALLLTALFSTGFVQLSHLAGLGSEDIANLQTGATSIINLQGLLLGGIIIGTLGALNDVTVTQSAAIFELMQTDAGLSFVQLMKKGFRIGREHILSLVNTLVLAYAGSSLFIFIFLVLNPQHVPYWVILNSETITDEIVGTVAGSIGLILAVPIVTLLASWGALYWKKSVKN